MHKIMLIRQITTFLIPQSKILIPIAFKHSKKHTETCPVGKRKAKPIIAIVKRGPSCLKTTSGTGSGDQGRTGLKRAKTPGKCRMGLIPEEWFQFLRPMTGVSGPYIFMFALGNYLVSKEILIMEHEYYSGLSVALVLYLVTTRLGPKIGAVLDKEVDAIANDLEKTRSDDVAAFKKQIKEAETAVWRAQGQKDLIDAKKENVSIQLEAIYRERLMMVYNHVRGRMEYHVRRHRVENRVKHKWMVQWILENVEKSITPEFKRRAMEMAIRDLEALANRQK